MMDEKQLDILYKLAHQIQMATEFVDEEQAAPSALLTAADLSRVFGLDKAAVKKNLQILKQWGLIQAIGINPKQYRFDRFRFRQLLQAGDTDDPLQKIMMLLVSKSMELKANKELNTAKKQYK